MAEYMNKIKYIERANAVNACIAIREDITRLISEEGPFYTENSKSIAGLIKKFEVQISAVVSADVVEVVHGRWNSRLMKDIGHYWVHWCSACNELSYYEHKFCPNCGARMDGDGDV